MLKCSIFLPFSLEIKTESNTHFVTECHTKMLVCFLSEQARQKAKERLSLMLKNKIKFSEAACL